MAAAVSTNGLQRPMKMRNESGFSLIELMITVALVAIVSTLAVSSYKGYSLRANRVQAVSSLLQVQTAQEKFFVQNGRYAGTGALTAPAPGGLGLQTTSLGGGNYTIAITPAAPTTLYTVTATPTATSGQNGDKPCQSFSIDQSGRKAATNQAGGDSTAECWK